MAVPIGREPVARLRDAVPSLPLLAVGILPSAPLIYRSEKETDMSDDLSKINSEFYCLATIQILIFSCTVPHMVYHVFCLVM